MLIGTACICVGTFSMWKGSVNSSWRFITRVAGTRSSEPTSFTQAPFSILLA